MASITVPFTLCCAVAMQLSTYLSLRPISFVMLSYLQVVCLLSLYVCVCFVFFVGIEW